MRDVYENRDFTILLLLLCYLVMVMSKRERETTLACWVGVKRRRTPVIYGVIN